MKINKQLLKEIVGDYSDTDRFKVVLNKMSSRSRWSIYWECIIQDLTTGKFYDAYYSVGATESQDESPFDYIEEDENGDIELDEVEPYEVMVTRYKKIKESSTDE